METTPTPAKPPRRFAWKTLIAGAFLGTTVGVIVVFSGLLIAYNFFQRAAITKMAEVKELKPLSLRADLDWSVTDPDGKAVEMKTLEGQPLLLHFWNPTCVSCLAEIPSMNALFETFAPQGLTFAGIALNAGDDLAADVAQHGIRFPVYGVNAKDIPAVFAVSATPATYVVDRNGFIVLKHIGAVDWSSGDAAVFLEALLAR